MRFKNRAFALIWIVLSVAICCGLLGQYEKNLADSGIKSAQPVTVEPINNEKLTMFFLLIALMSLSMGVFFFVYSDELQTYLGNYQRSKEI